jgi:ABC-type amino acid transport substrate-binding protein
MSGRLHRRSVIGLLGLGVSWLGASRAFGQAGQGRIRYGGDAAFAPFESLDVNGRPAGFQIDLLADLGRVLNIEFEVSLKPWQQTEQAFRDGNLDVISMVDTESRRDWALFARGHATPALAVYRPAAKLEAQGPHDLQGQRVAVLEGEAMRGTLSTWLAGLHGPFLRFPNAAQALAALHQGQADVALLPRAHAEPLLVAGQAPGIVGSHLNLALQTYALAVSPGQQALLARLQAGLDRLEANGQLEALRTRWLGSHREGADKRQAQPGWAGQPTWAWGDGAVSATGPGSLAAAATRGRRGR